MLQNTCTFCVDHRYPSTEKPYKVPITPHASNQNFILIQYHVPNSTTKPPYYIFTLNISGKTNIKQFIILLKRVFILITTYSAV